MGASGDTTKLYPLAVVVERCDETRGKVVGALRGTEVLALTTDELDVAGALPARVVVIDAATPGMPELAVIRSWRANDKTGHLDIVLVGNVPEQSLPAEFRVLVTAYVRKPVEWETVARIVGQIVNRSGSGGFLRN